MIPLSLKIKNFLSYGAELQTINFAPYHLICLSGKNGHGKSALLDAMTWAVWGTARKVLNATKPDQGLLRLGQNQMMVIFDFMLNNTHYRIRREFSIVHGKPYAQLDFGMINHETDKFIPLSEKTIRNSQATIEQTIGLNFDTFVNSAFIRQGQSNEFSKKSPKERKEILAHILGLNQYDLLRNGALEKIKEINTHMHMINMLNEKRSSELQKKDEILAHYVLIDQQRTELQTHEIQLQKQLALILQEAKQIEEQQNQWALLCFEQKNKKKQTEECKTQIRSIVSVWRTIQRQYRQSPNLQTLQEKKYQTLTMITNQQKEQQQFLLVKEEQLAIQKAIHEQEQAHIKQVAEQIQHAQIALERIALDKMSLQTQIKHITHNKESSEQEIIVLSAKITELQRSIADLAKQQISPTILAQFEKRKAHYQKFITLGTMLKQELTHIKGKTNLVQEDDPSCPLCEQNLSLARRRFLKSKFIEQEQRANRQLSRLFAITQKLKTMLIEQHNHIEESKKIEQRSVTSQHTLQECHAALVGLRTTHTALNEQLQQLQRRLLDTETHYNNQHQVVYQIQKNAQETLNRDQEYNQLKNKLLVCENNLLSTSRNPTHVTQLQTTLEDIDRQLATGAELQKQFSAQHDRKQEIHNLCTQAKLLYKQQKELALTIQEYEKTIKRAIAIEAEKNNIAQQLEALNKQKEQLFHDLGQLAAQRNTLEALSREQLEATKQTTALTTDLHDYQTIAHILGKDGIQALLIEDTIPELEHETNQLLAKLTNNQSQLFFECTRDLKHGGTKETLDIKIADTAGIRPYELFSGGEAFRIDFALRIALAKLLAHRAGTALQTLIIDEGFGSQDEEGLGHIMDAIHKIQDDFAKVIIVSHLPGMKEQFPVHFMVEKGAQGSRVRIVEQD